MRNEDADQLDAAANVVLPPELRTPFLLKAPAAAPYRRRAGRRDARHRHDRRVPSQLLRAEIVVVESAGGFRDADERHAGHGRSRRRARRAGRARVGVRLGCINHALLTADAIAARGLKLAGWVANHVDPAMSFPDENIATMRDWRARAWRAAAHSAPGPPPESAAAMLDIATLVRRCAPRSIDNRNRSPIPHPRWTGKRYDPSPDRRHRATRRDSVAAPVSQRWRVADVVALFELPFNDLLFRAQQVHREHFDANAVQLSTLLSIDGRLRGRLRLLLAVVAPRHGPEGRS